MPHDTALIATVAAGLGVAFVLGLLAARLKLPPIVGYLLAGIVVGPFTPGYVANAGLAGQLAEFGVILLMFGVGLRFSLQDLAEVRRVVVPGALAQILITGSLSAGIAYMWGWGPGAMLVLGLSTAVASTVVLLKGLEARDRLDSAEGRIAVGWLVVEDLAMVLALVLLPALAPMLGGGGQSASASGVALPLLAAVGKVAVFVLLMVFVGRRAVPWLLEHVAKVGSRELFTLAVLVSALGVGTVAAELFGVSFALGAFFAGAVISESELSQRAAADALPLQDAFAVLFFVSVGMLFQPAVIFERPMQLLALVAVIVVGKTMFAFGIMRLLRQSPRASVMLGAGLGQIGEFSFIVTALGVSMGLLPREGQALVVAAALIAITINGAVLSGAVRLAQRIAESTAQPELAIEMETEPTAETPAVAPPMAAGEPAAARATTTSGVFTRSMSGHSSRGTVFSLPRVSGEAPFDFSSLVDHVILVGYGRVGTTVGEALTRAGIRYVIVEERGRTVAGLRKRGELAVYGDATRPDVLERAGIAHARLLVVTAPEPIRARRIVEVARAANPRVAVAVRTHSATEQQFFEQYLATPGVTGRAVYAEREAALSLAHFSLLSLGRTDDDADAVIDSMRGAPTRPTETFAAMPTTEFEAFLRASEAGRMRRRATTTMPPGDPPPRAD